MRDMLHTRVMPSTDYYTDHRLGQYKVASTFKSSPKRKGPETKKLQVHALRDPRAKNNFQVMLEVKFNCVTGITKTCLMKQIRKSKKLLENKRSF